MSVALHSLRARYAELTASLLVMLDLVDESLAVAQSLRLAGDKPTVSPELHEALVEHHGPDPRIEARDLVSFCAHLTDEVVVDATIELDLFLRLYYPHLSPSSAELDRLGGTILMPLMDTYAIVRSLQILVQGRERDLGVEDGALDAYFLAGLLAARGAVRASRERLTTYARTPPRPSPAPRNTDGEPIN